jgi:hypothetical protein
MFIIEVPHISGGIREKTLRKIDSLIYYKTSRLFYIGQKYLPTISYRYPVLQNKALLGYDYTYGAKYTE